MPKYTVCPAHVLYGIQNEPEPPSVDNGANSIRDIPAVFRRLLERAGIPLDPTEPHGPSASVHFTDQWDGISYGDYPAMIVDVGPRGGIRVINT